MKLILNYKRQAGREFDVELHTLFNPNADIVLLDDGYNNMEPSGKYRDVPYYSTNINEAFGLVEKYDFYGADKNFDIEMGEHFHAFVERSEEDGTYKYFSDVGSTPAEAICLAYHRANKEI